MLCLKLEALWKYAAVSTLVQPLLLICLGVYDKPRCKLRGVPSGIHDCPDMITLLAVGWIPVMEIKQGGGGM